MPFLPNVPRCQHLKVNGTQCGSPALKRNRFCFFHKRFQEEQIKLNCDRTRRRATFILPVLEDANSVQISLMQIMRLLASGQMDSKIAGLLLFALQTASYTLRRTTFEPIYVKDVVIDRRTIDQTCIGGDQWCEEDFPDPEPTEEEKAAAAAEEAAEAAAAARAAAKEKARRQAAAEAEADRLIRQGAAERAALAVQTPPPRPTAVPTASVGTAALGCPAGRSPAVAATPERPATAHVHARDPVAAGDSPARERSEPPPSPSIRKTQQEKSTQESRYEPDQRKHSRQGPRLGHEHRQATQPAGITERKAVGEKRETAGPHLEKC
jgi:hypothetical protein